ncbi:hypothetical protein [uncultured Aquimarina sp.]|uniref:hypothetical protein n=1 Tax=uncultured Aquimarina sp. TaxID=575652 RepID=UPI00261CC102|nr:hypothetical protein [uncultured Aquimarina sp.]
MKPYFIKTILFCAFFCFVTYSYSQSELKLKKGVVVDSLTVPSSKGVYSIYLPKSFDLNNAWPILFGFDSTGNMNSLTHLFSKSAEELGYVIVVSNYAEKLSVKEKSNYVLFFMKHIISLFPIQDKRMYVFGAGEDAILNTSLPLLYKQLNGVVAIGNYNQKLNTDKNLSYIGMVGDKNFRYRDFLNTHKYLKRKGVASDVYVYDGKEEFPPEEVVDQALPYFTMEAMIKGSIPKDSIWIANRYEKDHKEVKLLKSKKEYLRAYDKLTRMRSKYDLFFDVDILKEEQKEIRKIDAYKKRKRLRSKYYNQEIFLRQTFILSLEEDIDLRQYNNLGWWQYRMEELDKLAKNEEKYASDMVLRIKGFLKNTLFVYKKEVPKDKKEIDRKIFLNILSTIVDKNDFESYRNIISLCVTDGDNETALFYLEKMLKSGYKDAESLYTIEGTLALRISKEYNNIIKKYLGSSKYFDFD